MLCILGEKAQLLSVSDRKGHLTLCGIRCVAGGSTTKATLTSFSPQEHEVGKNLLANPGNHPASADFCKARSAETVRAAEGVFDVPRPDKVN